MVDAPEKIGYDQQHPESNSENDFHDSDDDSQESIPKEQRRVTLGAVNEIVLENLEDKDQDKKTLTSLVSMLSTQSQLVSDLASGAVPSGDGHGDAAHPGKSEKSEDLSRLSTSSCGMSKITRKSLPSPSIPSPSPPVSRNENDAANSR